MFIRDEKRTAPVRHASKRGDGCGPGSIAPRRWDRRRPTRKCRLSSRNLTLDPFSPRGRCERNGAGAAHFAGRAARADAARQSCRAAGPTHVSCFKATAARTRVLRRGSAPTRRAGSCTVPARTGVLRIPMPVCRLRWSIRSHGRSQCGTRYARASGDGNARMHGTSGARPSRQATLLPVPRVYDSGYVHSGALRRIGSRWRIPTSSPQHRVNKFA